MERTKKRWVALVLICGVLVGEVFAQQQKRSDSGGWRKMADLFMADLVANRVDKAVERFEPEFVDGVGGRQKAKTAVEQLFAYCGRPLDSEFKHEERGFKQYLSGRRKEMRKFYYAQPRTSTPKAFAFSQSTLFRLTAVVTA